jgi:hypothetical protein
MVCVAVALALMAAACAGSNPPSSAASPAASAARVASDVSGPFQLTFELPRTTFTTDEAIEGRATLAVVGRAPIAFGSSGGGPFVFDFAEITGRRRVGGAMTADCAPYRLEPGKPMTSAITKSGGFSADDPDAAFYRSFLQDPIVKLPAGDWTITAVASLVEGVGCSGASRNLMAPISVHVSAP